MTPHATKARLYIRVRVTRAGARAVTCFFTRFFRKLHLTLLQTTTCNDKFTRKFPAAPRKVSRSFL